MTHLADKMKQLADNTTGFVKSVEDKVDQKIAAHTAAQTSVMSRLDNAFATVDKVIDDANSGAAAVESALTQLTNQ